MTQVINSNAEPGPAQTIRAAQYVRMSTEHQKYSTENQAEIIARYAAQRGFEIVETYLEQVRSAFTLIADAERALQGQEGDLAGQVRVSVSTTYGHHRLPAVLERFARAHPQVNIELSITNRNVDLVAEGYDLAIRLGQLPDSSLVGRKLEDASLCLVAAPSYLERAGTLETIEDLARHQCLPFVMPSTGRDSPWLFQDDGRDVDWTPPARVRIFDDVLGVVSLAEAGMGVCQTYDFIVRDRIAQGRLVEVLPSTRGRSRPFSVIFAPHRRMSAASRTLIDFLVAGAE